MFLEPDDAAEPFVLTALFFAVVFLAAGFFAVVRFFAAVRFVAVALPAVRWAEVFGAGARPPSPEVPPTKES